MDVQKLKGKMAEKNYSITSLAQALGISRNTLSSYLISPGKIPYETIKKMADLLCDSADDAMQIFFAAYLRGTKDLEVIA